MKKILSFFAAMLCAVAVFADPVVLPATLDVSNVSFRSDGMPDFVVDEGDYAGTYFDMGAHDSSNDTLLYAEWDVTIEPLLYNISVDVYNTNSWSVRLHILNQANEEVKSLYYKGHSGEKGQFAIGSLDLRDLEAGDYKVRAHCSYAWSALKLKDVIFDADYSGATVALPGELLPAYAELSANASISNGAIAFKPSTAPDEYANWNVSFAKAGSYNVKIDITASNGHNYGVELITEDEETIIGAVNEGGQVSDTGEKELGAIEVPAAGNYIVHLTNAIKWSEAVLNSITFAAPYEPAMKTIYCKMDKDWWKADGAAVGVYTWDDGSNAKAAWPGERMTPVEGEADLWSVELDVNTYHMCIFTRVNGTGDIADWGAKTIDLTIPTDENDMFTITNDDPTWGNPGCTGAWSKYEPAAPVGCDWANIGWLGDGSPEQTFGSQFKVCVGDPAPTNVVNIQKPDWAAESGIYISFPSAAFGEISLPENKYAIDGAGIVFYISAFVAKETEVSVVCENKEIVFTVYNAKGTDTPTAIESNVVAVKAVKMIENGQLIIIRNGEKFNAQGQLIR